MAVILMAGCIERGARGMGLQVVHARDHRDASLILCLEGVTVECLDLARWPDAESRYPLLSLELPTPPSTTSL